MSVSIKFIPEDLTYEEAKNAIKEMEKEIDKAKDEPKDSPDEFKPENLSDKLQGILYAARLKKSQSELQKRSNEIVEQWNQSEKYFPGLGYDLGNLTITFVLNSIGDANKLKKLVEEKYKLSIEKLSVANIPEGFRYRSAPIVV